MKVTAIDNGPDVEISRQETVRQLSKALPHAARTPFEGVTLDGRFFDWDGPIHKLDQRTRAQSRS